MASSHETIAPAWSVRLTAELNASDQAATKLVGGLTDGQLNWQPAPGAWSVGQCIQHLCITNEAYLPPISIALKNRRHAPVEEIAPGWFGGWFLRSFVEPSPETKRVAAPTKIRPGEQVDLSVLDRFLAGNQACRDVISSARSCDVNRIRFWNPFIKGLRFSVGTGLQIIASHERRHLLQAERVQQAANFPR